MNNKQIIGFGFVTCVNIILFFYIRQSYSEIEILRGQIANIQTYVLNSNREGESPNTSLSEVVVKADISKLKTIHLKNDSVDLTKSYFCSTDSDFSVIKFTTNTFKIWNYEDIPRGSVTLEPSAMIYTGRYKLKEDIAVATLNSTDESTPNGKVLINIISTNTNGEVVDFEIGGDIMSTDNCPQTIKLEN